MSSIGSIECISLVLIKPHADKFAFPSLDHSAHLFILVFFILLATQLPVVVLVSRGFFASNNTLNVDAATI